MMCKIAQPNQKVEDVAIMAGPQKQASRGSIIQRLFTKEDNHHVHKVLGLSCLVSFAYRFANVGERDGNFGPHWQTLFFIAHHFCLNASAFIFRLPERRITSGDRIWPEYRAHSLIFTSRSLLCMLVLWFEQAYDVVPTPYWQSVNALIVLGTCLAADYASSKCKHSSNTVRGFQSKQFPEVKLVFSAFLIQATATCLIGSGRYTTHLVFIFIIQVNAFLMTLRRKNVGSTGLHFFLFGSLMVSGTIALFIDGIYANNVYAHGTLGIIALGLRIDWQLNKYILWAAMGLLMHWVRFAQVLNMESDNFWQLSFALVFVYAWINAIGRVLIRIKQNKV